MASSGTDASGSTGAPRRLIRDPNKFSFVGKRPDGSYVATKSWTQKVTNCSTEVDQFMGRTGSQLKELSDDEQVPVFCDKCPHGYTKRWSELDTVFPGGVFRQVPKVKGYWIVGTAGVFSDRMLCDENLVAARKPHETKREVVARYHLPRNNLELFCHPRASRNELNFLYQHKKSVPLGRVLAYWHIHGPADRENETVAVNVLTSIENPPDRLQPFIELSTGLSWSTLTVTQHCVAVELSLVSLPGRTSSLILQKYRRTADTPSSSAYPVCEEPDLSMFGFGNTSMHDLLYASLSAAFTEDKTAHEVDGIPNSQQPDSTESTAWYEIALAFAKQINFLYSVLTKDDRVGKDYLNQGERVFRHINRLQEQMQAALTLSAVPPNQEIEAASKVPVAEPTETPASPTSEKVGSAVQTDTSVEPAEQSTSAPVAVDLAVDAADPVDPTDPTDPTPPTTSAQPPPVEPVEPEPTATSTMADKMDNLTSLMTQFMEQMTNTTTSTPAPQSSRDDFRDSVMMTLFKSMLPTTQAVEVQKETRKRRANDMDDETWKEFQQLKKYKEEQEAKTKEAEMMTRLSAMVSEAVTKALPAPAATPAAAPAPAPTPAAAAPVQQPPPDPTAEIVAQLKEFKEQLNTLMKPAADQSKTADTAAAAAAGGSTTAENVAGAAKTISNNVTIPSGPHLTVGGVPLNALTSASLDPTTKIETFSAADQKFLGSQLC
uniref:Capsid maturation protease n=2 Tax=Anguillid herpesvirus 1 TaxID=150286 RepID=A0A8E5AL87_9VIRU|nr:capsid maturation protease [Anguillid herpesvirus 1]